VTSTFSSPLPRLAVLGFLALLPSKIPVDIFAILPRNRVHGKNLDRWLPASSCLLA
jgi:hypothetical protein